MNHQDFVQTQPWFNEQQLEDENKKYFITMALCGFLGACAFTLAFLNEFGILQLIRQAL